VSKKDTLKVNYKKPLIKVVLDD